VTLPQVPSHLSRCKRLAKLISFISKPPALSAQLQLTTLHFKFLISYTNRLHYFNSATLDIITSAIANLKPRDEQKERPRK
jgi:hypothetical protein